MKLAQKSFNRLREILRIDKEQLSHTHLMQIKSDIYDVLKNYFEITLQDVEVEYFLNDLNKYQIKIEASSDKVKKSRIFY